MKILHLEDQLDWAEQTLHPELNKIDNVIIYHAPYKDRALEILSEEEIDFAILDLSVPSENVDGSASIEHGLYVASYIRANHPGIPILILTGQSTELAAEQFEEQNTFTIFWDGQERNLVKLRPKRRLVEVLAYIKDTAALLRELESIELSYEKKQLNLDTFEKRVIQLFCRTYKMIGARVTPLNNGLSSSKVLYIQPINSNGQKCQSSLAKIDRFKNAELERVNFHSYITQLAVGSFPSYLNEFSAGCGNTKGVFFQFAEDYTNDYFDYFFSSDEHSLTAARATKDIFENWTRVKSVSALTVGDIRRMFCSDEKVKSYGIESVFEEAGLQLNNIESVLVQCNLGTQHADLHGMNVLFTAPSNPIVIDYGDVRSCPIVIDPITLELSHFFHPKMADKIEYNLELATRWFEDDAVAQLSSNPQTAGFLREWSKENSLLGRDYVAGVYSYVMRQLTYEDTNKEFAKTLLLAACSELSD